MRLVELELGRWPFALALLSLVLMIVRYNCELDEVLEEARQVARGEMREKGRRRREGLV
jgi:hypothetical protein